MRIRTTSRRLTILVVALSLLSLVFFLLSGMAAEQRKVALSRQLSDTLAAMEFGQGSDVLTANVRAYAATGDDRYRKAFETELHQAKQREQAIARLAAADSSERETKLLGIAKDRSDELVRLEERIFAMAGSGRLGEAIALAYGDEYRRLKDAVLAPINQAITEIAARRSAEVSQAVKLVYWTRILAVLATLLNTGVMLSVLLGFFMRRVVVPLASISQMLKRLDAGERGLSFREPAAADELRELGEMLETHARVVDALETQREALLLSEQQQRFIFNAAASGIAWTRDRVVVDCNERCCQQFGLTREELIGRHSASLFEGGEASAAQLLASRQQLAAGDIYRGEARLVGAGGRLFWARLCGKMIDSNQPELGTVWVVDDISAEHEASERMEEARRLAEQAALTKANFLANMSHEIRTPMNAIIGMAHLLGRTSLDERQADYLRRIDVSSQHLLGLLNDVLDFSKLEAGRLDVEAIDFDLERMCENVCTVIKGAAEAKRLELLLHIAPGVPRSLVGDPMRLSQILINYLNNAVKFTTRGQIDLHVEGYHLQGKDLMLRFEVRDTGIGLSEAQIAQLFRSFEQLDASTTRRFGGTGLGLAIAKGLAQLMGGEVGVFSRPGAGSSFWFTAKVATSTLAPAGVTAHQPLAGLRALVVDDNESARHVLGQMLNHLGMRVVDVESGVAALDAVKQAAREGHGFDVACIDWQLPQADGLTVAQQIATLNLEMPPRIILVTAFGRQELRQLARQAGVEHVLGKPITASALLDSLQAVLQGSTARRAQNPLADPGSAQMAGRRVLLAEDNETNQIVARDLLRSWGVEVEIAGNGSEAVDKALGRPYDLVLMDMHMPVMDGLDAARRIRQEPRLASMPILAMTASATNDDRRRCLEAGMSDHIAKPVDPARLLAKLLQWSGGPVDDEPPRNGAVVHDEAGVPNAGGLLAKLESAGLRAHDALERLMGRTALYLELLKRFNVEQQVAVAQISADLLRGEVIGARQRTHSLRGVAGTLGAEDVVQKAAALEEALGGGGINEAAWERFHALEGSMHSLLALLQANLTGLGNGSQTASRAANSMTADFVSVIARITNALESNDFSTYQLMRQHEQVLAQALGDHYPELRAAIDRFDFDLARFVWRKQMPASVITADNSSERA